MSQLLRSVAYPFDDVFDAVIDVRSPGEYAIDHLPGAINLPIMSNAERAEVGTLDRQVGNFEAKRRGAAIASRNIAGHLDSYFADKPRQFRPLIYCWRGGQRSGSMALVLQQIGFPVMRLDGGYKSFRRHVVGCLESLPPQFRFYVLDGATGTRKTDLLALLAKDGAQVIDLEGLANHRGSLLGANPDGSPQPSQKGFETALWQVLGQLDPRRPVFVEGESAKIGQVFIPPDLFAAMKAADRIKIEDSLASRARYLCRAYRHLVQDHDQLAQLLGRLRYRHGHQQVEVWLAMMQAGNILGLVEDLLARHYDPSYQHAAVRRDYHFSARFDLRVGAEVANGSGDDLGTLAAVARSIHQFVRRDQAQTGVANELIPDF